jgi:hypothetical protein
MQEPWLVHGIYGIRIIRGQYGGEGLEILRRRRRGQSCSDREEVPEQT